MHIPKEMIHYGFTKTAQLAVARGLAELTAGTGVTVNPCCPGRRAPTASRSSWRRMASAGKTAEAMAATFVKEHRPTSLIERFATVEEVANMVVYVCSQRGLRDQRRRAARRGGVVQSIA